MAPRDETYRLHVHGLAALGVGREPELHVQRFAGREKLSELYEIDVEVFCDIHHNLPKELLGRRASFAMQLTDPPQTFHGIVNEVTLVGYGRHTGEPRASYRVRLVPQMWLMTKKRRSRVFQNQSVDEVVKTVLHENGVPALWFLQQALPKRDYCVQFEETDEELVRRLMAEVGIFFFFLQPSIPLPDEIGQVIGVASEIIGAVGGPTITGEVVVFGDDALAYHALGELPPALESLIRAGLSQLGQVAGGVVGEVASVAAQIGDVVSEFGGPDLRSLLSFGNSRTLHFRPEGESMTEGHLDILRTLSVCEGIRSDAAVFRAYDPRRPLAPLHFTEPSGGGARKAASALGIDLPGEATEIAGVAAGVLSGLGGPLGEAGRALGLAVGHADLEVYDHHDPFILPDWDHARSEPSRMLRSQRADQQVARGTSLCPLVTCGRRFTLADHPVDWVNREYAIVEVRHFGTGHSGRSADHDEPIYQSEIAFVPSDVPFLPPRPPRRSVQTCLTATVVGGDAEIHTHDMGQIKVRFHWERGEHGTCWVRTMQSWAGTGWGTQFMPRIGMEVVVGFEGGDPDRPLVLGCVYNGTHPPPFSLPESQSKSGIVTHSTPGGEGFNELSFEDRKNAELVYLHAQRDLELKVKNDRRAVIDNDDHTRVEHDQRLVVHGAQHTRIENGQEIAVRAHRRVEVEGVHEITTRGTRSEAVTESASVDVGGSLSERVRGSATSMVSGDATRRVAGSLTEHVRGARNLRVEGLSQSSSGGTTEIESDAEVVLRVGNSSIRISESRIEIISPEIAIAGDGASARLGSSDIKLLADGNLQGIADKILLKSSGAALGLSSEASVDGARVLLNSPQSASDSVEPEEREPTIIELKDDDGNPIPRQRYRIELEDGSAMTGVLDDDGRAVVFLEGGGEVVFPDLGDVRSS